MKQNGRVPLIRARGYGRLPQILEERAGEEAVLKALKGEGLPIAMRDLGGMPIPAHALVGLFARAGALAHERTLGLQVGARMSYSGYGPWAIQASSAATLGAAIQRLNRTSGQHQASGLRFTLEREGARWLWRIARPGFLAGSICYTDHEIVPMISFARLFLGSAWLPDWVEVDYPRDENAALLERALGAPVLFGRRAVGLPFTRDQLHRNREESDSPEGAAVLPARNIYDDVLLPAAPEPVRSFSSIVALRLIDGEHDLAGAARLAGIGTQGLQRQLRTAGYTYRDILEIARRKRAVFLLTKTELAVSDIAVALGYEDHPNFTRAFVRWMECSPSAFRQRHALARRQDDSRTGSGD
ncbi:AraC family transcriptional regulator ligand-binding domain-containing protein [Pseudoxanthobacter sp.]|uniref:AraC family transcriptional regulator n=1 Tax=Pseudoxanthobacter sp. TaxID=1925742 RepID=UPI002FE3946F